MNILLIFIIIAICISYTAIILIFSYGWKQLPHFEPDGTELPPILISIVIACKNEQEYIGKLIVNLIQQTYRNFELILVNDHSVDNTKEILESAQRIYPNIQSIDAIGFGKKNALREGILRTKGELIVTTDADCLPTNRWLESIVSFQTKFPTDLLICPVCLGNELFFFKQIQSNGTFFSQIQALEFASLIGAAAGSAGAGMPVLCNGANLVFKKNIWLKCQADLHEEEQSGDDMFLLESVKKQGGIIRFLKNESAFVMTKEAKNFVEFIKQRRRWASKSTAYTDGQVILTACSVFVINLLILFLIVLVFCKLEYLIYLIGVFGLKFLLDTGFLYSIRHFFQLKNVGVNSFLLSVVYPFYSVFVVVSSLVHKPVKWK
jgi:glycosyltransferase involved in cell wall biosynthesis